MTRLLILVSFLFASTSVALAQDQDDPARMIADRIEIAPDGDLIASDDIEIFHGAENLIAEEIRYDMQADALATAGIGVKWDGQCSSVVFSADRRFTDLDTSPPQSTYVFSIELKGYSTGLQVARSRHHVEQADEH